MIKHQGDYSNHVQNAKQIKNGQWDLIMARHGSFGMAVFYSVFVGVVIKC